MSAAGWLTAVVMFVFGIAIIFHDLIAEWYGARQRRQTCPACNGLPVVLIYPDIPFGPLWPLLSYPDALCQRHGDLWLRIENLEREMLQ